MQRSVRFVQVHLKRIHQPPGGAHFAEGQIPLLFAVDRFEEEEAVLREAIAHAHERVFEDERAEGRLGPPDFRLQMQAHPGFSLEDDIQTVGSGTLADRLWLLELDGDACLLLGADALAGAKVKGDSLPTRDAGHDFECGEGIGAGLLGDVLFVAVGRDVLAIDIPFRILSLQDEVIQVCRRRQVELFQGIESAYADPLFILQTHGQKCGDLKEMTLEHVAEGPRVLEVSGPSLEACGFVCGDFDVMNEGVFEKPLEDGICVAEIVHIAHRLLAEIVIEEIDIVLLEAADQLFACPFKTFEVVSHGFFDDATERGFCAMHIAGAKIVGDRGEDLRRHREVRDTHGILPFFFHILEARTQCMEVFFIQIFPLVIEAVREKFTENFLVYFRDVGFD